MRRSVKYARSTLLVTATLLMSFSMLVVTPEEAEASSSYTPHDPIYIDGNDGFTAENGVAGGSGAPDDPYVIEGWEIRDSSTSGIEIRNTDSHFVIRDVYLETGRSNGIALRNVSNGVAKDSFALDYGLSGISLVYSFNITLLGNQLSSNYWGGISSIGSVEVTIANNSASHNWFGIYLDIVSSVTITGNAVSNNLLGLVVGSSDSVTVGENRISSSHSSGLAIEFSTNLTVRGNVFTSDGIRLRGSSLAEFNSHRITSDNLVNGKPIRHFKDCSDLDVVGVEVGQLIITNCSNIKIADLEIVNADRGVQVAYVDGAVFVNNEVSQNRETGIMIGFSNNVTAEANDIVANGGRGIYLYSSTNARLAGNKVSDNGAGIVILGTPNVTLVANAITSNHYGSVFILYSNNATIDRNEISFNGGPGIHLGYSTNVTVVDNKISENDAGVLLDSSLHIRLYHNNFIDNSDQAGDDEGVDNAWDADYPIGGNYWSDYAGQDECSGPAQGFCPDPDGIGDTPYVIGSKSQDHYPLVGPYDLNNTPPTASFTASLSAANMTVALDASSTADFEDYTSRLEVRWDWEDDWVWDTAWTQLKKAWHGYTEPGIYIVRLEVRDTGGLTDQTTKQIVVRDTVSPEIIHTPPEDALAGQTIVVTASVRDADILADVVLYYRGVGDTAFTATSMVAMGNNSYRGEIPAQGDGGSVEYYIIAIDQTGNMDRSPDSGEYTITVRREASPLSPVSRAVLVAVGISAVFLLYILHWRQRLS